MGSPGAPAGTGATYAMNPGTPPGAYDPYGATQRVGTPPGGYPPYGQDGRTALVGPGTAAGAAGRRGAGGRRKRWPIIVALIAVLLVAAGVGAYALLANGTAEVPAPAPAVVPSLAPTTTTTTTEGRRGRGPAARRPRPRRPRRRRRRRSRRPSPRRPRRSRRRQTPGRHRPRREPEPEGRDCSAAVATAQPTTAFNSGRGRRTTRPPRTEPLPGGSPPACGRLLVQPAEQRRPPGRLVDRAAGRGRRDVEGDRLPEGEGEVLVVVAQRDVLGRGRRHPGRSR